MNKIYELFDSFPKINKHTINKNDTKILLSMLNININSVNIEDKYYTLDDVLLLIEQQNNTSFTIKEIMEELEKVYDKKTCHYILNKCYGTTDPSKTVDCSGLFQFTL